MIVTKALLLLQQQREVCNMDKWRGQWWSLLQQLQRLIEAGMWTAAMRIGGQLLGIYFLAISELWHGWKYVIFWSIFWPLKKLLENTIFKIFSTTKKVVGIFDHQPSCTKGGWKFRPHLSGGRKILTVNFKFIYFLLFYNIFVAKLFVLFTL